VQQNKEESILPKNRNASIISLEKAYDQRVPVPWLAYPPLFFKGRAGGVKLILIKKG
jgi:hypothetical protein